MSDVDIFGLCLELDKCHAGSSAPLEIIATGL